LRTGLTKPRKVLEIKPILIGTRVVMPKTALYNARAEHGPARKELKFDATNRRFSDGRGVFRAGGYPLAVGGRGRRGKRHTATSPGTSMLKVLLLQLGLGMVVAMLFWGATGYVSGYSALLGGLTCVVPNAFLALRLAVPRDDSGSRPLIRAAYTGELGKLALTVIMFTVAFTLVKPLAVGPLFVGFIACQLATFAGFLMKDGGAQTSGITSDNNGE
jgi:ATP synthase protein I